MPTGIYKRTEAQNKKISKALKAHVRTEEHKAIHLKTHLGNKHSLGSIRTPESIQKQLATKQRKKTLTYKLITKLKGLFY
tara:strand:+ start:329 stop:568 length:240 start_codon:yes stop_codon:yes gene_type:complete